MRGKPLTQDQKREIMVLYRQNMSVRRIAAATGIHHSTVAHLIAGTNISLAGSRSLKIKAERPAASAPIITTHSFRPPADAPILCSTMTAPYSAIRHGGMHAGVGR